MKPLTIAPPATFSPDYKSAPVAPKLPSARATSEPAGPTKVVAAVATGSLPVSSVETWMMETLTQRIETLERAIPAAAAVDDYEAAVRHQVQRAECVSIRSRLRAEMERRKSRQPGENDQDQPRAPRVG